MARTVLQIPANLDHVRTARLVAGAAARRAELTLEVSELVALATDEACSVVLAEIASWLAETAGASTGEPKGLSSALASLLDRYQLTITIESIAGNSTEESLAAIDLGDLVEQADSASSDGADSSEKNKFVIEISVRHPGGTGSESVAERSARSVPVDNSLAEFVSIADKDMALKVIRAIATEVAIADSTLGYAIRMAWVG